MIISTYSYSAGNYIMVNHGEAYERRLVMENNRSNNRFWKGALVGALVMAFAGLIVVGFSAGIFLIGRTVIDSQVQTQQMEEDSSRELTGLELERIAAKMDLIQQIVGKYFLFEEDLEEVENGIYTGLMYGLDDPYSVYYDADAYNSLNEDTSGVYCGIGAMVSQQRSTGIITVSKVFKEAPAFDAGMLPGDILYKVDDIAVTGMDLDLVISEHIRGEEGTFVPVTVLRGENNDEVELEVERRQVIVPTVERRMLEDNIGYIYIMQFDTVTSEQFKAAVDELESQGMEKLMVDLRGNPGGVLDSVVEMLAYILPEDEQDGLLLYTRDRDGKGDKYFSKDGKLQCTSDFDSVNSAYPKPDTHELDMPMAILVNGNSASAAEVFTGTMMDYDRAVVVGTQTFGKGIVQNLIPLGDGTAIKLTTSHYYTPSGFDLHEVGLKPDVEIDLEDELKKKAVVPLEEDNQVLKALEVLREE